MIPHSRTPALDLKKVKEALQSKIKREEKHGYVAMALLDEAQSQTGSSVRPFQQSAYPTPPAGPTISDHTADNFIIDRTFNSSLYEAVV